MKRHWCDGNAMKNKQYTVNNDNGSVHCFHTLKFLIHYRNAVLMHAFIVMNQKQIYDLEVNKYYGYAFIVF